MPKAFTKERSSGPAKTDELKRKRRKNLIGLSIGRKRAGPNSIHTSYGF
jgi:hypothetical protein